ncbi:hypothetical protein Tco_1153800 [Tanacetum coccineum]
MNYEVTRPGPLFRCDPIWGCYTLFDIALTEAEQMKLAIKRSKTQLHISQPSGSGAHEGTGVTPEVPDVPTYQSNDEEISWKSSDEDSNIEESSHRITILPFSYTNLIPASSLTRLREAYAPLPNVQAIQKTEDTHVILTAPINPEGQQQSSSVSSSFISNMLNPRPDTSIDLIFNTEGTSLVNVPVTTIAEPPLVFATTLPPPSNPLITHLKQTPFKQTNQFAEAISSIPAIVDAYLANKMHEVVKTAVQLQSNRLRDEAQAENEDFLNKLNDNIKKIIKDQVKQQVKAQVSKILPRIEKTLKKILIEKIESNKSIHRSNEQKNLYKALVEAYESDKLILETYGDTVSFKRCRDDEDKDEEPSAGSNWGSKRRRAGKEPGSTSAPKEKTSKTTGKSTDGSKSQHKSAGESAHIEDPMHTDKDLEEPAHQKFDTGATEEQSDEETSQHPDWYQKPAKHPTPDRD